MLLFASVFAFRLKDTKPLSLEDEPRSLRESLRGFLGAAVFESASNNATVATGCVGATVALVLPFVVAFAFAFIFGPVFGSGAPLLVGVASRPFLSFGTLIVFDVFVARCPVPRMYPELIGLDTPVPLPVVVVGALVSDPASNDVMPCTGPSPADEGAFGFLALDDEVDTRR
jgi:hypothetical protein